MWRKGAEFATLLRDCELLEEVVSLILAHHTHLATGKRKKKVKPTEWKKWECFYPPGAHLRVAGVDEVLLPLVSLSGSMRSED